MKFKVGDKVKILRKDSTFGWNYNMAKDVGCTFLLSDKYKKYGVDEGWLINEYAWSEDALALVSPLPEESLTEAQEPLYTVEEVFNAIQELTSMVAHLDLSAVRAHMAAQGQVMSNTPSDADRLKAIHEG